MKQVFGLPVLIIFMVNCKNNSAEHDVCNMAYYANDSNMVEVIEVEPDLIAIPVDTVNLKGRWELIKYHSPFFNIEPTDSFHYILKISGKGLGIKFCDNKLMSGYVLKGDSIYLKNGSITEIKSQDEPIETAIKRLLFNGNPNRVSITQPPFAYLTIFGKEGEYAEFKKIVE